MVKYTTRPTGAGRKSPARNHSKQRRIYSETQGRCYYCGRIAECMDHIIPYSFGGSDGDYNLIAACLRCNGLAADHIFDDLEAKKAYILQVIEHQRKSLPPEFAECIECREYFRPSWGGSTRFLCATCADE